MSYAEDMGYDAYDCEDFYNSSNFISEDSTTWETKDGEIINIVDMENSHLVNTIKLLQRKGTVVPELMYKEIKRRKLHKGLK